MKLEKDIQYGHPAGYWEHMDEGRILCKVCPRYCKLRPGQRGFCYVRAAGENGMVLTTFGRSSGFCSDPIEKKPLNHFYPGTSVLSFGTAGCNLGCKFCQNWDISKSRDMDTLASHAPPEAIAKAARDAGCESVAFTYNDPVIFAEYAMDTAKACKSEGLHTVVVSAGYMTGDIRKDFFANVDAANIDLKAFTNEFYRKICFGKLDPVLDTLRFLKHETEVWLEITTLLIPGENDGDEEIRALSRWIRAQLGPEVPLHFTAFHPDFRLRDKPRTPPDTLRRARKIARDEGLHFVYVGNVHDSDAGSTYCHRCGVLVIERDWYRLGIYHLDEAGQCKDCGTPLPGRFGTGKGYCQSQRYRVHI